MAAQRAERDDPPDGSKKGAQRAERDDPPDGSKKGALMAERDDPPDGSKKNGGRHNKIKKPLTGAGWGKMMEGGGSRERFCYSSFVKIFYQL